MSLWRINRTGPVLNTRLTRRRVVVKFTRVVGEDSSKYHRPKSPSGSRTSLRKVSGPNALRIKISSGPASPGRPRTHRKVLDLPTSEHRAIGEHQNFLGRFFIGLIKFNDPSCQPAVNPELAEGKEEELEILPSPEGGVIVLAPEKGSAFLPPLISRLAVNGVGRLARWVHVRQGSSWYN
ncbi:hypothetical protein GEV33_000409 [Tenebrio molitor]|uniref:Uncharacterized protein n=1 Tax=Tenebrio molitor TaxID=7067 RepID=A0A8J6LKW0_TENMO|nr:hypothetical protein GEV33_000409 [Tenebrio molitor]